jgi:hypothetical protein
MDICQYCLNEQLIDNIEHHKTICIYTIYNTNYNNKISNKDIEKICSIINLFKLHKYSINAKFDIRTIIQTLILKNSINNNLLIPEFIYYLLHIKYSVLSYNEILKIIEEFIHYSINDILNIINAYKICYKHL